MINTVAIKKLLIEHGTNASQLAKEIGISSASMYMKINGKRGMTLREAERIQEALHIPDSDFGYIFMSHIY